VEHCEKGSVALKSSLRMLVVDEVHTHTIITPSPHHHQNIMTTTSHRHYM
jgi:hypothetical protein